MNKLRHGILTVLTLIALSSAACGQRGSDDVDWLIDVLEIKPGSVVADIGAGDGDQALEIARHIGAEGHIYSTELGRSSVEELRRAVEEASADNITVIEGDARQTNLPQECCDAIYMRRVYHHFGDPAAMNASLLQSLKPGGRLAVIDFEPRGTEAAPGGRSSGSQHGVTRATVVEELSQAGFALISSEDGPGRDFYVVMRKPAKN
ncbi:class I SAM-dependent methyltransferase [Halalkalibaculum sp. DA3122]|uniref:class I SAM-dependent methyltransferase n=1 Tax=unclassified Halalkalibaculum TaxID=2964617 RepID=UPI0037540752